MIPTQAINIRLAELIMQALKVWQATQDNLTSDNQCTSGQAFNQRPKP